MLFDWLVAGQIVPTNPAAAVRSPKRVVKTGKTKMLEGDKCWRLIEDLQPNSSSWLICLHEKGGKRHAM